MHGSEPDMVKSVLEKHFVKFSYSEGNKMCAADSN